MPGCLHVGQDPAHRQFQCGQQFLGFAFPQLRVEEPAQLVDDGGDLDQCARRRGGVVVE